MKLLISSNQTTRRLMILLLMLISGQTWAFYQAYTMAGQMDVMSMDEAPMNHSETMDHEMPMAGMNHSDMFANDGMDCCQVTYDCQCPPSACSVTHGFFNAPQLYVSKSPTRLRHIFQNILHLHNVYAPPYRPPIT